MEMRVRLTLFVAVLLCRKLLESSGTVLRNSVQPNNNSRELDNSSGISHNNGNRGSTILEDSYSYNYYNDYVDLELKADNLMDISINDRIMDCGKGDWCPDEENHEKLKQVSGEFRGKDNFANDFKKDPYKCRCDKNCTVYGDCCWDKKNNVSQTESQISVLQWNPWRCNPVQFHTQEKRLWALMISECPNTMTSDKETSIFCRAGKDEISPEKYNYLIDIPVYSNATNLLYKNIYCAKCHHEKNENILKYTLRLSCDKEFSPELRQQFHRESKYIPGQRLWENLEQNATCILLIDELEPEKLERYIPNIRYCGSLAIESCPETGTFDRKTRQLCSSYSQYIRKGFVESTIYKNIHCLICNSVNLTTSSKLPNTKCVRTHITRFGPSGVDATIHGTGLNFLFDFSLSDENYYVGFDMVCKENEVWDYIRHKCHIMTCGSNYTLVDGFCRPLTPSNETVNESKDDVGSSINDSTGTLGKDPECYRILLNPNEYTILPSTTDNSTISINISKTGEVIYLAENEYESINETGQVSICAKFQSNVFRSRFSPLLNYLSIVSVALSVVFLFFHMLLYCLLPQLRNLPAKNLFCLTVCLFLSQLLLLIFLDQSEIPEVCVIVAVIMHYLFLCAFFWMNVMSFDVWRTFSSTLMRRNQSTESKNISFRKYSVFGWGIPLVIVSISLILDFGVPDNYFPWLSKIKPSYGQNKVCWISQRLSLFVFFALPVAIVICFNLILFALTAKAIMKQNQESQKVFRKKKISNTSTSTSGTSTQPQTTSPTLSSNVSNKDEVRLNLYVKLALIMGLTWILGFVSSFASVDWLWYLFVVLNGLQGTFIFFAFDFKRKVFKMLKGRFAKRKRSDPGTSTSGTNIQRRGTTSSTTSNRLHTVSTNTNASSNVVRKSNIHLNAFENIEILDSCKGVKGDQDLAALEKIYKA